MSATILNEPTLRDWVLRYCTVSDIVPDDVATTGSGPFEEHDFDSALEFIGIAVHGLSSESEILVVGERDWNSSELLDLVDARAGKPLRNYSQEMFLTFTLLGLDPFDEDVDLLRRMGRGHPALEFLATTGSIGRLLTYHRPLSHFRNTIGRRSVSCGIWDTG